MSSDRVSQAADSPPPSVEIRSVTRRFGEVVALSSVSLSIARGEFFSLLGPSGCGKTTLLRMIAGLDSPDEGAVIINGRNMTGVPANERPVNTVFQSYALFPHLSVLDNVSFGLRMKKLPEREIRARVERAMELAAIPDLARRFPAQLSGGQKQRVALARAIVNEPQVLLLDEPLGALDLKLRKQLQNELHDLQRRLGITFLHVTHDQEEALTLSDRIAVMDHGIIAQLDRPGVLYEHPRTRFLAQFLGSCNLVEGKPEADGTVHTGLGSLQLPVTRPLPRDLTVMLAIRPEKIRLSATSGPGGDNSFEAMIQDVIYRGSDTLFRLKSGQVMLEAVMMNHHGPEPSHLTPGKQVTCRIPPECIVLLED
jgi:spermidine/putrescine transport system ATP-binding protein